jgi:hypothetical protein
MAKANPKHTTKPSPKSGAPKRSEVVKQSVIYLQSIAAFHAGFDADHGNFEIAGAGSQLGDTLMTTADSALTKLTKLGKLSVPELKAKAAVFRAMMKFESDNLIEKVPRDFLATFAIEIEQYFREAAREIPAAD